MIRGSSAARYRPKFALLRMVTGDVVDADRRALRRRPEPVERIERLDARLDPVLSRSGTTAPATGRPREYPMPDVGVATESRRSRAPAARTPPGSASYPASWRRTDRRAPGSPAARSALPVSARSRPVVTDERPSGRGAETARQPPVRMPASAPRRCRNRATARCRSARRCAAGPVARPVVEVEPLASASAGGLSSDTGIM